MPKSTTGNEVIKYPFASDVSGKIAKTDRRRDLDTKFETGLNPLIENKRNLNAFRKLRNNIANRVKESSYILMITSVSPGGGATYVALNLASSIVLDKDNTALLLNCNTYNPSLDSMLQMESGHAGLAYYLQHPTITASDVIYSTEIPRLSAIPAGNIDSGDEEWATKPRFKQLFSEVQSRDQACPIIMDAPCISTHADAYILSNLCDYIVLVVAYAKTTVFSIQKILSELDESKIIGIVFNNTPKKPFS